MKVLYRYKTFSDWDKDRFLSEIDDIKNNRITLVSPELFNDPYDCFIPFSEMVGEEEFGKILKPYILESVQKTLDQELRDEEYTISNKVRINFEKILEESSSLNDFRKNFDKWSPKKRMEILSNPKKFESQRIIKNHTLQHNKDDHYTASLIWKELKDMFIIEPFNEDFSQQIEVTKKSVKVACFSTENNSMYFWSHYAKSHHGICLEYSFRPTEDLFATIEEVQYWPKDFNGREKFLKKFYSKRKYYDQFFTTIKSEDWKQEKEFRIVVKNVPKEFKKMSQPEQFSDFKERFLQKLDGSTKNFDGRRNLEKCECGEFRYRHTTNKLCAQIYCENCDEIKGSKSIIKHEYSYQPITKIYLGAKFNENTESYKLLKEIADSQNISVRRIKINKKKFALEEDISEAAA